ncbi:hypothetical protein [Streptomyces tauricus]|uniref:hypothetical protein n=1 Tax=Streptomyces tauricus TaxID=68274 RepID=UPI002243A9ED|nr:hypothetical protein [Streptomyces tauricus]MCW8099898.1 hypothetical protein [Streptomyces tauricus]
MYVTQASWKSEIFQSVVGFLPDWAQGTALGVFVLAVLTVWAIKLKRKLAYHRAVRAGRPIPESARFAQGRGADHLGSYAPQARRDDSAA